MLPTICDVSAEDTQPRSSNERFCIGVRFALWCLGVNIHSQNIYRLSGDAKLRETNCFFYAAMAKLFGFSAWLDCSCMKDEQHQFLTVAGQLPARLTSEQVAWLLGCQPHDISVLISCRLLKPLGNPAQNAIKYFAAVDVAELTKDRSWLVRMTQTISQHWHKCNSRQGRGSPNCGAEAGLQTMRVNASAA